MILSFHFFENNVSERWITNTEPDAPAFIAWQPSITVLATGLG